MTSSSASARRDALQGPGDPPSSRRSSPAEAGDRTGDRHLRPTEDLRAALGFLTRLRVGDREPLTAARLSRAAVWFPAVGVLVGAVLGGARLLAELALPAAPATVLALAAAMLVTGALHEDGLADTADGLGAHVGRERRLEIMRDPRLGTYGALALGLSILLAWSLLAGLSGTDCLRAALVGGALSRWSILLLARAVAPARSGGLGALLRVSIRRLTVATVVAATIALVAGGPAAGGLSIAVGVGLTALVAVTVRRALGGVTGDTFGAAAKLVEVGVYATLVAAWS